MSNPANQTQVLSSTRQRFKVTTVSGHEVELLHKRERGFYTEARDKYLAENKFTSASDIRSLDRLLLYETQVFRWQWQLAAGVDYDLVDLEAGDEVALRRSLKETELHISQIQRDLALTKAQREREDNESVGGYLVKLRERAMVHGVRRDKQQGKALELMNELFSIAGAFKRSNEHERRKLGFENAEDIVDYLLDVAKPQYDAIDKHYRETNQKAWIRNI